MAEHFAVAMLLRDRPPHHASAGCMPAGLPEHAPGWHAQVTSRRFGSSASSGSGSGTGGAPADEESNGGGGGGGGGNGGGASCSMRLRQDGKGCLAGRVLLSGGGAVRWSACADWERGAGPGAAHFSAHCSASGSGGGLASHARCADRMGRSCLVAHGRLLGSAWNAGLGAQPSLGQARRTLICSLPRCGPTLVELRKVRLAACDCQIRQRCLMLHMQAQAAMQASASAK